MADEPSNLRMFYLVKCNNPLSTRVKGDGGDVDETVVR
jgi:hypothetical protein